MSKLKKIKIYIYTVYMRKFQDFITLACILVFIIITSRELGEQIF